MKNITITAAVLALGTMAMSSCYSVMPISNAQTATESKANGKTVIVYYGSSATKAVASQWYRKPPTAATPYS